MHASTAVVFAQIVVGGQSQGVHAFVMWSRRDRGSPSRSDRGLRTEDRAQRRRQRRALVRRGPGAPGSAAQPLRRGHRGRRLHLGDREPRPPVLHDARHARPGRVCVGGAAINASKVALAVAVKYGLRRRQFGTPGSADEEILLDYGMHRRRLFPLLAHLRPALRPGAAGRRPARGVLPRGRLGARPPRWSLGPPAPRRSAPGTRPGRSRSAARPAVARATCR